MYVVIETQIVHAKKTMQKMSGSNLEFVGVNWLLLTDKLIVSVKGDTQLQDCPKSNLTLG